MNTLDFIADGTKMTLGWTLLHTLWQGALVFGLLKLIQWHIPVGRAALKYFVNCCALAIILLVSIGTYFYLQEGEGVYFETSASQSPLFTLTDNPASATTPQWNVLVQTINRQLPWIIAAWMIGVFFFSVRFSMGMVYVRFLKSNVTACSTYWNSNLAMLSNRMGMPRLVSLTESIHINKPIVVGYLRPMIILPLGLLSGLPYDQVEAILLHELSHIKRHDYLVNLIQSIVEIILFFNPFVWMISNMIRQEREHCCDDHVLTLGTTKIAYAKALAQLETQRSHTTPPLALALNKNKYQVYNRIKRIMESTVKKNSGKARPFTIIAIVATALICASWLGIGNKQKSEEESNSTIQDHAMVQADTTKDKKKNSATYSRQTITTYDEDGTPHEEVIEKFEGDEALRPLMSDSGFSFFMPDMPLIPDFPGIPHFPTFPDTPPVPFGNNFSYYFDGDTLPKHHFFSEEDQEKWEEFGREMAKRFEHFGKDHEEFGARMEEWAEQFEKNFSFHFNENFEEQMDKLHDQLRELHDNKDFQQKLDNGLKEMEEQLRRLEENMQRHKHDFRQMEENMQQYERELHEQLIKDGYLKKGEEVNQ